MRNILFEQDQVRETIGKAMTYGGSATSVVAWGLSASEMAAVLGASVAVIGLFVQAWATLRNDRREAELHKHRISTITNTYNTGDKDELKESDREEASG